MKLKLKPLHIALILLLIYIGSMIPFIAPRRALTLPEENIISYLLTEEQEDYAVGLGKTVLTFEYDPNCEACVNQRDFLFGIANEEREQIILQVLAGNITNSTSLRLVSYYGGELLRNPTEDEIWDALCSLMVKIPTYCRLREI